MNKLIVFALGLLFLTACGSDDDAQDGEADENIDYASAVVGDYKGFYAGTYSDDAGNNFGETGFATVTKDENDIVHINMQQGSSFKAVLDNSEQRPDIVDVTNGRGRFDDAGEVTGFFNVQEDQLTYTVSGVHAEGGTYEIEFEGTLID